jgi:hypothetical protein
LAETARAGPRNPAGCAVRAATDQIKILKGVELMPETKTQRRSAAKTQRRPAAKKEAATRKPRPTRGEGSARIAVERSEELSEDVLKSLDDGARSAIDAVRKFAETVDRVLPPRGEGPSRREEITDSALELAQRLIHTQADFLHKVVDTAGKSLTGSNNAKSK